MSRPLIGCGKSIVQAVLTLAVLSLGLPSSTPAARMETRSWVYDDALQTVLGFRKPVKSPTGSRLVPGAPLEHWAAVAVRSCSEGFCLYVADVTGNAERKHITIYRLPVANGADYSAPVRSVVHATYADGPQDGRTLLVTDDGSFVVTKTDGGFPLARVVKARQDRAASDGKRLDAAVSPDGIWIMLRSESRVTFHRSAELLAGNWREHGQG
jgi:hypothetical protein